MKRALLSNVLLVAQNLRQSADRSKNHHKNVREAGTKQISQIKPILCTYGMLGRSIHLSSSFPRSGSYWMELDRVHITHAHKCTLSYGIMGKKKGKSSTVQHRETFQRMNYLYQVTRAPRPASARG